MDEDNSRDIVIYDREDPSPFETMILIFCGLGGLSILVLGNRVSGALTQALPSFVTILLAAGLVIGSAIGLVGQLRRTLDSGLLEASGLVLVSGLLGGYSGFALALAGARALFTCLFFGAVICASGWRIIRIRRRIRRIQHAVETGTDELRRHGED
jgi:hypothetical protein